MTRPVLTGKQLFARTDMDLDRTQTKTQIQAMLASAGLRPDKHFGQHFLVDGNLMRKLVDSAEITPDDVILEVGGGTGGLSDLLTPRAGQLIIVEVDNDLAPLLTDRFADHNHVSIIHTDVLANKSTVAPAVLEALDNAAAQSTGQLMMVANLPYNVATPLLIDLLVAQPNMNRFCFTIQDEVADRIVAQSGSKSFGPVSVILQTVCSVNKTAFVPASAFWPPPKVGSAMLRLDRIPHPFEATGLLQQFIDLLRAGFAHRRKTLRYNLSRHLNDESLAKASTIIDLTARAETIPLKDWITLGQAILTPTK